MKWEFKSQGVYLLRHLLRLTQYEFARILGCTAESVRNWEHGRSIPAGQYIDAFYKICKSRQITPPSFFDIAIDSSVIDTPKTASKSSCVSRNFDIFDVT